MALNNMMTITRVKIKKTVPKNGLVGFASIILNDCLHIGNIAIFSRLNKTGKIRLVFPEKKVNEKTISFVYPVSSEFYFQLEKVVEDKMNGSEDVL